MLKSFVDLTLASTRASRQCTARQDATAVKLINSRLDDPALRLSDGVVGAIVAAICQAVSNTGLPMCPCATDIDTL